MYKPDTFKASIYTVGGTVQAGGGIYIPRKADAELFQLCRDGSFAYVLTPRQMGKSSLMVRTAEQLNSEGFRSVIVDLTQIGVQVTPEQWYLGLIASMTDNLALDTEIVDWWEDHANMGMAQRLTLFLQKVLLREVDTSVVIFIDEIDTTISLSFSDDFYAAIRYLYNARAKTPEFRRLSFVLLGVATPSDLIRDSRRTPFNIGHRVDLTDFTFDEALPLADGLGPPPYEARKLLKSILNWTEGHPYLTQRLCRAIADWDSNWSALRVDDIVANTFFGEMSKKDSNLTFVRDMLTKRAPNRFQVLAAYREIYREEPVVLDEERSQVKSHLKLSGVVRNEDGILRVRNLIYRKTFDEEWIDKHLPINWNSLVVTMLVLTTFAISIVVIGRLYPHSIFGKGIFQAIAGVFFGAIAGLLFSRFFDSYLKRIIASKKK